MINAFEKRKKVIYDFICDDLYVPMKIKEIAVVLQIPAEQREDLRKVLDSLVEEGKISLSKRGKYSKGKPVCHKGIFQANVRGFGFVTPEDGGEDIFISEENISSAFQGDEVEYIVMSSPAGKRKEGKIVRVISHHVTKVVGLYEKNKSFGFVRPDNQRLLKDIYIPSGKENGAADGDKVVVELLTYGKDHMKPEGRISEIIGHISDPGTDILSVVKDFGLKSEFPEKVQNQAERVAKPVSEADCSGRLDLRSWKMVTIDGEDAKDLDDAVSLTEEAGVFTLGVHIADVANYVQERSALDKEAYERGTSVYLADRVIPMLPRLLSNGICSLNAGEDRLALSCIMKINDKGEILDHQIAETVICVNRRMSYHEVSEMLEKCDNSDTDEYVSMVHLMQKVSGLLRGQRGKRGSIDFDFPESKIILDTCGKSIEIYPYERNAATRIIEDFMLIANETVAEEYFWRDVPFLYRTHEVPEAEKIRSLSTFINNFGYHIHIGNEVKPKEIQKLLESIEGTAFEGLISRLTLRSMKQAKYTTQNTGHFGLASKYYTHFTSPIRRYPDLQIHRIIKENLRGRLNSDRVEHYSEILPAVAVQCSEKERAAEEAEREVMRMKKAEYMRQHIGDEYDGVISGVTKWGAYVELQNTVEGLVHVGDMTDDRFELDESNYELVGRHTGKRYKLGQKVRVRVTAADKLQRTVNFEILGSKGENYG